MENNNKAILHYLKGDFSLDNKKKCLKGLRNENIVSLFSIVNNKEDKIIFELIKNELEERSIKIKI